MQIIKGKEFLDWFYNQNPKTQYIIESRLQRIELDCHWGVHKRFDGLIELKWLSGLRLYLHQRHDRIWVLFGGNKNGQQKDIEKAKRLLEKVQL